MRLSMPEAFAQDPGKARLLRLLLAALCVAVAVGVALLRFGGNGPPPDAARPPLAGAGSPMAAPAAGADGEAGAGISPSGEDNVAVPPPVVVRGSGTPLPVSAPVPGADTAERDAANAEARGAANFGVQGAANAGERERIFRLAEEDAERRLQDATSHEAAAAIAYRRAVAGAARGRTGGADPAEAEAALESARAVVRAARRDFETASLKRAEAGAEARRAAETAGPGFSGRSMQRRAAAAAGQEYEEAPPPYAPPPRSYSEQDEE
jgi:hypothetical protein